jgi:hypothetical protein
MTSDSGHEAQKRMYTLYWWAKTGGPKKFGHDTFETTKEIDEYNADDLLSMVAGEPRLKLARNVKLLREMLGSS